MQTNNRKVKMQTKIEKAKLLFKSKANATNILKLVGLIDEIKKEETQKGKKQ